MRQTGRLADRQRGSKDSWQNPLCRDADWKFEPPFRHVSALASCRTGDKSHTAIRIPSFHYHDLGQTALGSPPIVVYLFCQLVMSSKRAMRRDSILAHRYSLYMFLSAASWHCIFVLWTACSRPPLAESSPSAPLPNRSQGQIVESH